jgi:predicted RNA-binding Zn-ribbon protein involved in translation (DUF1610 family)
MDLSFKESNVLEDETCPKCDFYIEKLTNNGKSICPDCGANNILPCTACNIMNEGQCDYNRITRCTPFPRPKIHDLTTVNHITNLLLYLFRNDIYYAKSDAVAKTFPKNMVTYIKYPDHSLITIDLGKDSINILVEKGDHIGLHCHFSLRNNTKGGIFSVNELNHLYDMVQTEVNKHCSVR